MSPRRASEAQAREEIDRQQRGGLFDGSLGRKPAVFEYQPDADLRDTAPVTLLEDCRGVAPIHREGLPDGRLKGGRA